MILFFTAAVRAQGDFADPVSRSELAGIDLPNGALLIREQNVPANYRQLFTKLIESNSSFRQGRSEYIVLAAGNSKGADLTGIRGRIEGSLRAAGWDYVVNPPESGISLFTATIKQPVKKGIFGYWVPIDDALILAMTEVFAGPNNAAVKNDRTVSNAATENQISTAGVQTFNLSATDENVNVMGDQMPKMPSFPPLAKTRGKMKGYVKDLDGKPLRGAAIGLGSIRVGYSRVVNQTVTDAKGYYEVDLPLNSPKFHFAAYALDYGAGRAAMALHPADGSLDDNAPIEGGVENFVLLPYGIADRALMAENSNYGRSFYGGSIELLINVGYPGADRSINKGTFMPGSEIEIRLTPLGALIDGSPAKAFAIRKRIGENTRNQLFINNIPVGKYSLAISSGGRPVGMKQRLPENSVYGIQPVEANGEATILFYPGSGDPTEIGAGSGGWNRVEIYLDSGLK
ncbi:MAG TPA: hypothetical protein VIL74_08715 [Pyrinomonadaceae bacterium]